MKAMTLLLDRGAMVDARDDDGRNALMRTATSGKVDAATLLLNRGAAVDANGQQRTNRPSWRLQKAVRRTRPGFSWTEVPL